MALRIFVYMSSSPAKLLHITSFYQQWLNQGSKVIHEIKKWYWRKQNPLKKQVVFFGGSVKCRIARSSIAFHEMNQLDSIFLGKSS